MKEHLELSDVILVLSINCFHEEARQDVKLQAVLLRDL